MFKKENDPTTYNYYFTDETGKERCIPIHAGEYGWTEVTIAIMQEADHREALSNRYYEEAKNPLVEWKKKRFQDGNDDDTYEDPMDTLTDEADSIEAQIAAVEDAPEEDTSELDRLARFIVSLSPEQKALYEELYVKGKSNRALAKEMGVAEGTIRYRHNKMLQQLRKMFDK